VVLAAMDADVIKTYVELGMGVGLVASIAYDEQRDTALRAYVYDFIRCFAPPLTRELISQAMAEGEGSRFEI
jgi:LysR family cys regulon transcriptional activator